MSRRSLYLWTTVAAGSALALSLCFGSEATARPQPEVSFTGAQVGLGAHAYMAYCSNCHGVDLGGPQAPLKGPAFTSLGKDTGMTLGTFFDFIVRDTPGGGTTRLTHDQYVEIMAYLLAQNGYSPSATPLRFDQAMRLRAPVAERAP